MTPSFFQPPAGDRYALRNLRAPRCLVQPRAPGSADDELCAIDLLGQCGSESLGHAPFSGTGGQSDFVRAANRSRGGKAFIVLPSTAKGDTLSRIVPSLSPGTHVSTSKNDINYVVTEYGVAQLRGKSAKQRAQALIAIAHPDFRGELTEQAKRSKLL